MGRVRLDTVCKIGCSERAVLEGDDNTLGWPVSERVNEAGLRGWVFAWSSIYSGVRSHYGHPHPAYNIDYTFRSIVRKRATLGSERIDCSIVT